MASCRCPRRVLLGLCDRKPHEFLAQHQQLQRYPRDLWSYKFKFTRSTGIVCVPADHSLADLRPAARQVYSGDRDLEIFLDVYLFSRVSQFN